nr:hypothetical protein [Tanacetum cinerariifolium]
MVAYLSNSDASKGFKQIIDFLNRSYLKYGLTVNPNIYVSCIKQFWTTVAVKQVNNVTRLQALVYKKKVVITKAIIPEALPLDDEEGDECLPNKEIFAELARMGYEKPSTKLTFYKAFFSSHWKFLIHIILQCMSAKRTSWNEFSSSMASAVICLSSGRKFNFSKYIFNSLVRNVDSPTKFYMYPHFLQLMIRKQVGDLSTHTTKYTSSTLTQKVFANMRRVGKGFSRVETPLFESMLVEQPVDEEGDADENVKEVNAGDAAEGDVSAPHGEVPTVAKKPSIPSPTPPTPPPQPSQGIPLTSQRVKTSNETVLDNVSNQGRMIAKMDQDTDVVLEDDKEVADEAKEVADEAKEVADAVKDVEKSSQDQGRTAESQAKIYKIDMDHANKVLSMHEDETGPAELNPAATTAVTFAAAPARVTAAPSRRRKGVVIRDPEEESTTSTIIPAETKSKDKGKGILVEEPKPLKKKQQIKKAKEDHAVKRYQVLKRKPQTEAQARKNMMMYLKNVAGFKLDYFKGISYDDIRPIFEAKFNSNVDFLLKTKEQIEEDGNRALKRLNDTLAERAAKRKKLDEEVEELKRHPQIMPNEDDDYT